MIAQHKWRLLFLAFSTAVLMPAVVGTVDSFESSNSHLFIAVSIPIVMFFWLAWTCGWYLDSRKQQTIPPCWFFVHKRGLSNFKWALLFVSIAAYVYSNWATSIQVGLLFKAAICIYLSIDLILDRVSHFQKS